MEEMEEILRRIREDYEKEIENIIKSAKEEAKNIEENAKRKAEEIRKRILDEAKREAEKEREKILSLSKLEARKLISSVKEEMINRVIKRATEELKRIDIDKYKQFLRKRIEEAIRLLNSDNLEIIVRESDMEYIREIVRNLNRNVKISKINTEISGGVIIRDLKTNIELNYTFEKILERKIDKIRTEVAKILFL